jgi:hypothetical protein
MVMVKAWNMVKEAMISIEVFAISENSLCNYSATKAPRH